MKLAKFTTRTQKMLCVGRIPKRKGATSGRNFAGFDKIPYCSHWDICRFKVVFTDFLSQANISTKHGPVAYFLKWQSISILTIYSQSYLLICFYSTPTIPIIINNLTVMIG